MSYKAANRIDVESRIRQFVVSNFLFGDESHALRSVDSLLGLGIVDSTGILELVGFLEQTYQLEIKDDELTPENLDSIDAATSFVMRKL
jgi:acyl carrier protein